jgi:hypothetical protein
LKQIPGTWADAGRTSISTRNIAATASSRNTVLEKLPNLSPFYPGMDQKSSGSEFIFGPAQVVWTFNLLATSA